MFNLIAGALLFSTAVSLTRVFDCKVEKTLPLTAMALTAVIYPFGLLDHMEIGYRLVMGIMAVCAVSNIVGLHKLRKKHIVTTGAVFYGAALILYTLRNRYHAVLQWDDWGQWAVTVKWSWQTGLLGGHASSTSYYKNYPPASALFHYFWLKTGQTYDDTRLFTSMAVLVTVFLLPYLARLDWKRHKIKNLLICAGTYLAPFAFYSKPGECAYEALPVDCLMGVCFAYILYNELHEQNFRLKTAASLLGIFFLTLAKDSGVIFAAIAVLLILLYELGSTWSPAKTAARKPLLYAAAAGVSCFLARSTWKAYLLRQGTAYLRNNTIHFSLVRWADLQEYQRQGGITYFKALLNYAAPEKRGSGVSFAGNFVYQSEFRFGPFAVPAVAWLLLLAAGMVLLCKQKGRKRADILFFAGLYAGLLLYTAVTSVLYIKKFSRGEIEILSSYARYLSTYFLAVYLTEIFELLYDPKILASGRCWAVLAAMLLLPNTLYENTFLSAFDARFMAQQKQDYEAEIVFAQRAGHIGDYVPKDKILLIYNGRARHFNYLLTPIHVESDLTTGDTTWLREQGQWHSMNYVYFDTGYGTVETPEFRDACQDLFAGGAAEIMDYGLYEVIYSDTGFQLEFVAKIEE